MDYQKTLQYMYDQLPMFHRIGPAAYKPDLSNTIQLCELLGNPQGRLKFVHVAGTNGKGSTSHLIASVLQEAGYKTGLYTSPHLVDFRERIRINGKKIPEDAVVKFVERYHSSWNDIQPSFFEITVIMALGHFLQEECDISVMEVGLGGRLDSTNIILPEVSVITNIGFDHMNLLGEKIEQIAAEKGGIIKEGVPVVLGEMRPDARMVLEKIAKEKNAAVIDSLQFGTAPASALQGSYQLQNMHTAFAAVRQLRKDPLWKISNDHIRMGFENVIANTQLSGRWQTIAADPLTIVDVAHNEDGIRAVNEQLKNITFEKLHIVFGIVGDKDATRVLQLLPGHAIYYFAKADIPRGMNANELQLSAAEFGLKGDIYPGVKEAFIAARNNASANDLVLVTGSVFTVAEVL